MFKNCTNFKVLLLPYVNKIADFSCYNLNKLEIVELRNTTIIGDSAFRNTKIKELYLENVEIIENNAFFNCKELGRVHISKIMR